jgi:hypothetical protein
MNWCPALVVASMLVACSKPAEVTPPPPPPAALPASTSATAGECAAILQNVQAGRDVVVNVKCDTPTEAKLIAALSDGKWEVLCPHVMPAHGWLTKNNEIEIHADIIPVPGSYWSQYGFKISVSPFGLSQVDFAYAHALDWPQMDEQMQLSRAQYARIQQISAIHPQQQAALSRQASELLISDDDQPIATLDAAMRKRIVDHIALRRDLAYEDGSVIDTLDLAVFRENNLLLTEITLLPYVDPYPSWLNDTFHRALRLTCSANQDVPLRTFKSLCTIFLEQQAMSPKTTNGEACDAVTNETTSS